MFKYINTVLTKPKEIYTGRNMKTHHFIGLILLMGLSLTLLSIFEILPIVNNFSNDYIEIKEAIPEFELINNQLESDTESFVYQTDSVLLYFDSDDSLSANLIDSNAAVHPAPISIGLLKNEIYFNITGTTYSFVYSNFSNLTSTDLMSLFNNIDQISPWMYIFLIITLIGLNLFIYITQMIPIILSTNLISFYKKSRLNFVQNVKVATLASMGPFIIIYMLNAFSLNIDYQFEVILVATLLFFNISISEMQSRMKQKDLNNRSDQYNDENKSQE